MFLRLSAFFVVFFFFAKKNGNKYKQGDNVQCTKMINNKIEERALKEVDRERENEKAVEKPKSNNKTKQTTIECN